MYSFSVPNSHTALKFIPIHKTLLVMLAIINNNFIQQKQKNYIKMLQLIFWNLWKCWWALVIIICIFCAKIVEIASIDYIDFSSFFIKRRNGLQCCAPYILKQNKLNLNHQLTGLSLIFVRKPCLGSASGSTQTVEQFTGKMLKVLFILLFKL